MKIRGNSGRLLLGALAAALFAATPSPLRADDFYGDVQIRAEDIEAHDGSSIELGTVWLDPQARRQDIHSLRGELPALEGTNPAQQQRDLQTLDSEVAGYLTFEDNFLTFSQSGNSTAAEDREFELTTLNPAVEETAFQHEFLDFSNTSGLTAHTTPTIFDTFFSENLIAILTELERRSAIGDELPKADGFAESVDSYSRALFWAAWYTVDPITPHDEKAEKWGCKVPHPYTAYRTRKFSEEFIQYPWYTATELPGELIGIQGKYQPWKLDSKGGYIDSTNDILKSVQGSQACSS